MAAPANVATLPEIRHLGPVADIVDMGSIMLTVPEFRGATEHEAVGEAQTAMIERYFAAASAGPAEGGSEAAVWDTVLGLQLTDLERAADDATQNAIALNILVGNALAAYGMPRGEVNGLVAQRSWRIAQTRNGGRIADAADAHIGLCVVTGNPDKPYESVAEVMHPFGDLLRVTDKNYGGNTALSSDIVRTADVEEATWLIELGVAKDDMLGVGSNLPDVSPEIRADMARDLLHRGVRIHRNLLRKDEPFCSVLPRDEVIDSALEHDPGALTGQTLEEQPQERRDAIVRAMLPKISSVNLDAWLTYTLKGDVSAELVTDIIDVVGERCTVGMFRPFDQLPDGSLQKMRAANVDDAFSTRLIGKLSDADQRVALQLAAQEEGIWRYSIYDDPSLFRVIGRQELLQRARDADQLRTVGHNIHNWTDGSDQELLLEIMDCPTISGCFAIANGAGRLPNLDKAWLLSELMERDNYMAIATGMAVFGDLVDQRQFIADRVADGATDCLQLHLQNFTQLTPGEMYDTLIDAGLFAIATANTLYFRDDRSAQSIFDDLLTRPGGPEALCKSLTFFSDLDIKPLYDHLIARDDENAEFTLASHFANFIRAGVDPTDILTRISQTQEGIERMLKAYQDVPEIAAFSSFEALLQRAFDMQFDRALLENLKLIPAAMHDRIVDLSFAVGRGYLCTTYESLQVDRRALGRRLCANGYDLSLSMRAESFYGRDLSGLGFEDLLADGAAAVAIKYRHRFADYSEARAVAQLVADEKAYVLNKNLRYLQGPLSQETALFMATSGYGQSIVETARKFGPVNQEIVLAALEADDPATVALYEMSDEKIGWLDRGIGLLGKDAPPSTLYATQFISEDNPDPLPPDLLAIGVKSKGAQGINELRGASRTLRNRLISEDDDPDRVAELADFLINNRYAQGITKRLVRFDQAEWGSRSRAAWRRTIENHINTRANHAPLPEGFVRSEPITIRQIDAKEFDPSKIDQDARDRYTTLATDVKAALELSRSDAPDRYGPLITRGQELLTAELNRLQGVRQGLVARGNTRGLASIDRQLQSIEAILNASPQSFKTFMRTDFHLLGNLKIKGLDSVVRTVAFARAFTKSDRAREHGKRVADQGDVSYDALTDMDGLVSYLLNNEVYHDYFRNEPARKSFAQLTDTTTLRAQTAKLQAGEATGRSTLTIIPTRGLLLELLGHMADACWASKYPSIANAFPNITGLVYLRDEGTPNERFVGGNMLIDTADASNNSPVLIMRGTNPIENYINRVKIEDFAEGLLGYVKSIAGDRSVGAIFDRRHGRALSNRPLLHQHLVGEFRDKHAQGGPLQLPADTTFNDYALSAAAGEPVYIVS